MFAVIKTGGKQYKVEKGQILEIETMDEKEKKNIKIEKVLLINDGGSVRIGTPLIEGAYVEAKVNEHVKGDKVRVYKMKAKKRYQKTQGHRQNYFQIEILDIKTGGAKKEEEKKA